MRIVKQRLKELVPELEIFLECARRGSNALATLTRTLPAVENAGQRRVVRLGSFAWAAWTISRRLASF